MKGSLVHTLTIPAGIKTGQARKVFFKSKKSSPGYEEYYPAYSVAESIDDLPVDGVDGPVSMTVKEFMGEYYVIEVEAGFTAPSSAPILELKSRLHAVALEKAKTLAGPLEQAGQLTAEEYTFYCISEYSDYDGFVTENSLAIAQLLKDETAELTPSEIGHTLSSSIRYDLDDLTILEWDGALLLDKYGEFEDVIAIVELANTQLVALRILDARLTAEVRQFRRDGEFVMPGIFGLKGTMQSILGVRARSLIELDAIDSAIKLYGDWYDAKIYSLAAKELYLETWRGAVEGKLNLLEKIFQLVSGRKADVFNLVLEASIVLLIVFEIVMFWYIS